MPRKRTPSSASSVDTDQVGLHISRTRTKLTEATRNLTPCTTTSPKSYCWAQVELESEHHLLLAQAQGRALTT